MANTAMKKGATGLSAAALLAALAVAWLAPVPGTGLYRALAGGRDVIQGHLGAPDSWSFATGDRVWINQSWGADALLFGVHRLGGDGGLFVFKMLALGGIVALVAVLARMRGASLAAALLAGTASLAAAPEGFALDPRLVGLLFVPLVLTVLHASGERRHRIWIAAGLVVLWANLHPSFLFGIAALVLWAAATFLERLVTRGGAAAVRETWAAIAAAAGALVLAGVTNPFGTRNLTLLLDAARSARWRELVGWHPLWGEGGVPWVFAALGVFVIVTGSVRGILALARKRRLPEAGGALLFDALLVVLVVLLSLSVRTLVSLAAVVLAPLAARLLTGIDPRGAVTTTAAAALLVTTGTSHAWMVRYYDPRNPLRPPESLFAGSVERGVLFPEGAARFLDENGIAERLFHPPRWEGYLRWSVPGMKLYGGGRAYEVHDPRTLENATAVLSDPRPDRALGKMGVHLAAVPLDIRYARFCERLLVGADSSWVYIYCDKRTAVLADTGYAPTRHLVGQTVAGTLRYPNPAAGALSRAMCLVSPATGISGQMAVTALEQAIRLDPADFAYALLYNRARRGGVDKESLIRYLQEQDARLVSMGADSADGIHILRSRLTITADLRLLYNRETEREKWDAANDANDEIADRIEALRKAPWAKGW